MKYPIVYCYLIVIFLVSYKEAYSQFPGNDECNCKAVKLVTDEAPQSMSFYTDSEAQKFVGTLISLLNRHQPRPFVESIIVIPGTCLPTDIAVATICDGTTAPKGRYILYNNKRMDDIFNLKSGADKFVLAHEVGHHTHNHLHFEKVNREVEKQIEDDYKNKNFGIDKIKHIQELEADALAIWFLKLNNPKIDKGQILNMINGISKLVHQSPYASTKDHPSFEVRSLMADKILNNWQKIFNSNILPTDKTRKFVIDEIDSILVAAEESQITEKEKNLREQIFHHRQSVKLVDSAKVFNASGDYGKVIRYYEQALKELELSEFYTDEEKKNIVDPLEASRKIVSIKNFFAIYPIIGLRYTVPNLSTTSHLQSGRQPVDASFKPGLIVGVRSGMYSWKRKSWYELSLSYSKKEFNTLVVNRNVKSAIEFFSLNCLTTGLHYTFSSLANSENPSQSWKTGLVSTIAPAYNYYFDNQYTNYVTQENKRNLSVQSSIGVTIGLGFEKISRKNNKLFGNFRVMANYSYEKLKMGGSEPVRGNFNGTLHHLTLSISYRQW